MLIVDEDALPDLDLESLGYKPHEPPDSTTIDRATRLYLDKIDKASKAIDAIGPRIIIEALKDKGFLKDNRFDWFLNPKD